MRVGMDVRYLSHGLVGGIHTHLTNVIPPLLTLLADCQVFLYADTKRPFELTNLPSNVVLRLLPYRHPLSSVYNDFFMWKTMARDKVDVAHFPASFGFGPASAGKVVTLHDEINLLPLAEIWRGHPKDPRTVGMMTYLHVCTRASLRTADVVITVSEYSRQQIARMSGLDPDRIVPVPHACPTDIHRITSEAELADVGQRFALTRPFVLAEAFKNPAVLVRAWRRLPSDVRAAHEIVFFSRSPDVLPIVHEAVQAGDARLIVRLARRDLSALYTMTRAFVFPSWIEGFGIPLLEAMSCGAPVIASDRGAIPEVVGDAAIVIDAEDDAALALHLTKLLTTPEEASRLRALGLERAAQFSWDRTGRMILACYRRALTA